MMGSIILRCGDRILALPLGLVTEVFQMVAIAVRLPRAPRYCLGVVDFHGQLLPVFDLGARLQLQPARDERAFVDGHVVVVQDSAGAVGYAVDEVCEVSDSALLPLPAGCAPVLGRLSSGVVRRDRDHLVPVIAPAQLLSVLGRHHLRAALDALKLDREALR